MKWFIRLVILTGLFAAAHNAGYRINTTRSLPFGVYKTVAEPPKRGDLASFCLSPENEYRELAEERNYLGSSSLCPSGRKPLLKKLAGTAGDIITLHPDGIQVNSKRYALTIKTHDSNGRPLPRRLKAGIIPAGKALMLSTYNPNSFDSRYFGLVDARTLHKVIPIFTFN
ncbi:conjugative transfer signal peptidase TraF [Halodesulfovibrio sp.]|jgi:conjugative transfer signal peptidase TraF|uniref:conjugative transfer signal peptidase TraF n=1 Tax=Halodesulfovibrio sp. TaxID=1912772 RepID=UPI0025CDA39D|nr:conjugative transfer signal peptidase TraF [Halodesulfovibrio sp.]MCT4625669.1 conjugative transfer signal peptidase TraF [Halodesulfovibrio sp.]